MAIGGAIFAAGRYLITWNGLAMGLMRGEGINAAPTISVQHHSEPINNSDGYAKTMIDSIYQGADWACQFTMIEWKAATVGAWWPFGVLGTMGIIGRLHSDMAKPLVMTSIAGTPAAAAGPATITASLTHIAPNFPTQFLMAPTLRELPIRLQMYPYESAGQTIWATMT